MPKHKRSTSKRRVATCWVNLEVVTASGDRVRLDNGVPLSLKANDRAIEKFLTEHPDVEIRLVGKAYFPGSPAETKDIDLDIA